MQKLADSFNLLVGGWGIYTFFIERGFLETLLFTIFVVAAFAIRYFKRTWPLDVGLCRRLGRFGMANPWFVAFIATLLVFLGVWTVKAIPLGIIYPRYSNTHDYLELAEIADATTKFSVVKPTGAAGHQRPREEAACLKWMEWMSRGAASEPKPDASGNIPPSAKYIVSVYVESVAFERRYADVTATLRINDSAGIIVDAVGFLMEDDKAAIWCDPSWRYVPIVINQYTTLVASIPSPRDKERLVLIVLVQNISSSNQKPVFDQCFPAKKMELRK